MPRKVYLAQGGPVGGTGPCRPAPRPAGARPALPPGRATPANRCGTRIAGALSRLPLTSFLTSSYDLRNWKAIGKARRHVRYGHDSRAERLRTGSAPSQTPTRIAARKPDDTPHATGENARQRDNRSHGSHGGTTRRTGPRNGPCSGNGRPPPPRPRRTTAAPRWTGAARTAPAHVAAGTTPRTRKHERNTVLLAASRIHGHCALPGRDFISTTIRNKGDGLCPRRWKPKEPMLS